MAKPGDMNEGWDATWENVAASRYVGIEKHLAINKKLLSELDRYVPRGGKVIELGCARGKFLAMVGKRFGFELYGVEMSEIGARMAGDTLARTGQPGRIFCCDMFDLEMPGYFDVVYSMGLIEHFEDISPVLDAHVGLLRRGGTVFITMPNLSGSIYSRLLRMTPAGRRLLAGHNTSIMNRHLVKDGLEKRGVEVIRSGYFGPMDFSIFISGRLSLPLHVPNQLAGYITYPFKMPASLSPYLLFISRKT